MRLCPNTHILFRVLNVNTCSAFHDHDGAPAAPDLGAPPASRRRRPVRAEPLIFAVVLTLVTLGINLSGSQGHIDHADAVPVASQVAAVH